jgi:type I restriction-modification system DNA methylase subunit
MDEFVFGDYNVGDFRNADSVELLKKCDVVITNPPFSIITQWYNLVKKYDKKFIGSLSPKFFAVVVI